MLTHGGSVARFEEKLNALRTMQFRELRGRSILQCMRFAAGARLSALRIEPQVRSAGTQAV
jgi:hypothetical protein